MAAGGDGLTAVGIGRAAPDDNAVARTGQAKAQLVAGQGENAAQAGLGQQTGVVEIKPPGNVPGGCCVWRGQDAA